MGVFLDEPKFPVIKKCPTFGEIVTNFNLSDWTKMTGFTAASLPVGYLSGGSSNVRIPSMYMAGFIGLMGGFCYAYQSSAGRLLGMFPNEEEVKRFRH